jgi:hypothetical protein
MSAPDDYDTLIAHHKKHHEEEDKTIAGLQAFIDGQETEIAQLRVERDEMREALEMVSDHIDINYGAHPDIPAYAKAAAVLAKYPVTSPNGDYCVCEEFGISNYSIRCVNCGKPHAPRR